VDEQSDNISNMYSSPEGAHITGLPRFQQNLRESHEPPLPTGVVVLSIGYQYHRQKANVASGKGPRQIFKQIL
jgi:hypothetical protein